MKEIVKEKIFKTGRTGLFLFSIIILAFILRVWMIDSVPASLSGDDVDIGYHAYSLSKTGKDYSGNFLPLHLTSLADKKSALYTYTLIPLVKVLGISEVSLRLPSAIFGVFGVLGIYLLVNLMSGKKILGLLAAFFTAISPWHIQYSRWSFEGILMFTLFIYGIYFLLKSFNKGYYLILSAIFLSLTPIAYHASKAFLPISLILVLLLFYKNILKIEKRYLIISFFIGVLILAPFTYDTLFNGGTERFANTTLFSRATLGGEIGFDRVRDDQVIKKSVNNSLLGDKVGQLFHNKLTIYFDNLTDNYLKAFSTEFLFIQGDTNSRHSIQTIGEFYKYQVIFLLLGLIFLFYDKEIVLRMKLFILGWMLLAPVPSIVTSDGGNHASRLLYLIFPLIFFISYGVYKVTRLLNKKIKWIFLMMLIGVILLSLVGYLHSYYFHYPWDSEKLWHGGYKKTVREAIKVSKNYDRVIFSSADEPSEIFFLAWSQYPPEKFQKEKDIKIIDQSFGKVLKLDNFYFPEVGQKIGLYELEKVIGDNTLYVAPYREYNLNLIEEPLRVPRALELVHTVYYESGEPAFYFLRKNERIIK